jgi:hypothetical protein
MRTISTRVHPMLMGLPQSASEQCLSVWDDREQLLYWINVGQNGIPFKSPQFHWWCKAVDKHTDMTPLHGCTLQPTDIHQHLAPYAAEVYQTMTSKRNEGRPFLAGYIICPCSVLFLLIYEWCIDYCSQISQSIWILGLIYALCNSRRERPIFIVQCNSVEWQAVKHAAVVWDGVNGSVCLSTTPLSRSRRHFKFTLWPKLSKGRWAADCNVITLHSTKKKPPWLFVCKGIIPTERPPLAD